MHRHFACALVLCLGAAAAPAVAQTTVPDPASNARIRVGPLFLTPTLALTNMGIDNNVFNDPDQLDPKQDFTVTVTPATDLWLRMGRTWITGNVKEDLVYYKTYASERSANDRYKAGWIVPLNRLLLNVNGSYLDTRERPGFEIDLRARRKETAFDGLVELRALSRTFLAARASRQHVRYAQAEDFLGTDLRTALNRVVTLEELRIRHELTPLTSLMLSGSKTQDRFDFTHERDADSTAVALGVLFDPVALIKGSANVGYRDYKPLLAEVQGYRGLTVDANLSYVAFGASRLAVQVKRDVEYSFDAGQPYYVQTGFLASLDQRLYGPVDVVARVGADQLGYRDSVFVDPALADRIDHVRIYGGSVGYRMSRDLRIAVNVDNERRTSDVAVRRYHATRIGVSMSYGF